MKPERDNPDLSVPMSELRTVLRNNIAEDRVGLICDDLDTMSDDLRLRLKAPATACGLLVNSSDPHADGIVTRLPFYDSTVIRDRLIVDLFKPQAEEDGRVSLSSSVKRWDDIHKDWNIARAMEDIGATYAKALGLRKSKDALRDFDNYVPMLLRNYGIDPAAALTPKGIVGAIRGGSQKASQIIREAAAMNSLSADGFLAGCRINGLKTETVLLEASADLGYGVLTGLDEASLSAAEKTVISQVLSTITVLLARKEPNLAQVTENMEAAMATAHWGTQVIVPRHAEYASNPLVKAALERLESAAHLRFSPPPEPAYRPYNVIPVERIRPHTAMGVGSLEFPLTVVDDSGKQASVKHSVARASALLDDIEASDRQQAANAEQERVAAEQERIKRQQAAEAHAAELALATELARGRDQERLAELERLVAEQATLLADFRGVSNSTLRKEGLLGKDSLDFALQGIDHLRNPNGRLNALRTLHGMLKILNDSPDIAGDVLLGTQMADDALHDLFNDAKSHLETTTSPVALVPGIDADVVWLQNNWTEFRQAALESGKLGEDRLAQVQRLLGIPFETEQEADEQNTGDVDGVIADLEADRSEEPYRDSEWTEEQLAEFKKLLEAEEAAKKAIKDRNLSETAANVELKRLAEKLDWVVFPGYKRLTTDDLINCVRNRFGNNPEKPIDWAVVEERSADMLLMKEILGGELYESSVRTFAKKDQLYFVLTFEHKGANYALAENPVWGNATYVLREDQFPLQAGETVLTVVKELRRDDARALGAVQVRHTASGGQTHPEKIMSELNSLVGKTPLSTV